MFCACGFLGIISIAILVLEFGIHFSFTNSLIFFFFNNSLQSKLTNKTESCNAESGAPTNERYREATTSTTPTSVSGAGGKRPGRAKVSKNKRTRSVPNIPGSDSGKQF